MNNVNEEKEILDISRWIVIPFGRVKPKYISMFYFGHLFPEVGDICTIFALWIIQSIENGPSLSKIVYLL